MAWSGTFDELIGGHILDFFQENISMNADGLAPYPDFFAVGLILILSGNSTMFPSALVYSLQCQTSCIHFLRFLRRRVGVRSQGVSDNQQDLHGDQHPGAAVCGYLWIHQGRHRQLADQQRAADEFLVMKHCASAPVRCLVTGFSWFII